MRCTNPLTAAICLLVILSGCAQKVVGPSEQERLLLDLLDREQPDVAGEAIAAFEAQRVVWCEALSAEDVSQIREAVIRHHMDGLSPNIHIYLLIDRQDPSPQFLQRLVDREGPVKPRSARPPLPVSHPERPRVIVEAVPYHAWVYGPGEPPNPSPPMARNTEWEHYGMLIVVDDFICTSASTVRVSVGFSRSCYGAGYFYYLEKTEGGWRVVGKIMTLIS